MQEHRKAGHPYGLNPMDVRIPGMDGCTATRTIRDGTHPEAVTIVAMTANAFVDDVREAAESVSLDFGV